MAKYKVLSTKKLTPSLIEQANKNDIDITEQEFITIEAITTEEKVTEVLNWVKAGKEYIAFTSANAVYPFKKYFSRLETSCLPQWKVFCLNGKTKEAVEAAAPGFDGIIDTAENAKALAQKIVDQGVKEIIFFCGNKRRDELPLILKTHGIVVHEVIVYKTTEQPVAVADNHRDAILFFSPSAVNSFFSANKLDGKTICVAIGKTTADAIAGFTDNEIIISPQPHPEAMLATLQSYFRNINCYK